jgi:carbonic anhydrase/acetyltransferase-like protein (isoleucine patch superfamily)
VCGDVTVGPGARIMHGAAVVAEGGSISLGRNCIVLENAVLRATERHSLTIGDHCLIGPHAHVAGAVVEDEVFLATGVSIFHGARLGKGSEVRINGVVHVASLLAPGTTVPIGWIAVGDPAQLFPPEKHDEIWAAQKPLDFPLRVYGIAREEVDMKKVTARMADMLGAHGDDEEV